MKKTKNSYLNLINKVKKKDRDNFLSTFNDNIISCICNEAHDLLYTNKYKIPKKQRNQIRKYVMKKFSYNNIKTMSNKSYPISKRRKALLQEGGGFVDWLRNKIDKINIFLQKAVIGDY